MNIASHKQHNSCSSSNWSTLHRRRTPVRCLRYYYCHELIKLKINIRGPRQHNGHCSSNWSTLDGVQRLEVRGTFEAK